MSRYQSFAVLLSYTMAEETVKGKEHIFEKNFLLNLPGFYYIVLK